MTAAPQHGTMMPDTPDITPASPDIAALRGQLHDIRGILSPALMKADQLAAHPDEKVRAGAELIIKAIEATVGRLDDMRRTCLPAIRGD
ncbi:hypothetical protein [Novacetimonas cocois]|nr:hypothetical protein [Novacetimonas cocois]